MSKINIRKQIDFEWESFDRSKVAPEVSVCCGDFNYVHAVVLETHACHFCLNCRSRTNLVPYEPGK